MSSGDNNTYTIKREHCGGRINLKPRDQDDPKKTMVKSEPHLEKNFELKNPKTITIGNITEKSFHKVHTEKTKTQTKVVKHLEGGWPEQVKDPSEPREVNNWKRAMEKKEDFFPKVKGLISSTTEIIKKNLRMDIYEDYFENANNIIKEDNFSAKIKSVYKDNFPLKRAVNKVNWHPEDQHLVAVAYKVKKQEMLNDKDKLNCLIWDINKPNAPTHTLHSNSEIVTVAFHTTKLPHLLAAGCANGTISIYDIRDDKLVVSTKLEDSHHEAISDIVWLKSRLGTEFVSTSTDGKVIWWDNRTESIVPDKPLFLTNKEGDIVKEYGGTKIEYHPDSGASKFLIATEQGVVFLANKKKNDSDINQRYGINWGRHLGPITGIQRCPSQPKFMLTVGDWTARIWPEDLKIPIFISKYHSAYLTDCLWNPIRHGIFFVSRSDGWVNAYDLCYKTSEPAFSYKVGESGLTSMAISNKGNALIVGDEDGKISYLKLSKSFYEVGEQDNKDFRDFVSAMFEREQQREKNIEQMYKQKKVAVPKDETAKIAKAEQSTREKIKKIEERYIPFVSEHFNKKLEFSDKKFEDKKKQEADKAKAEKQKGKDGVETSKKDLPQTDVKDGSKPDSNTSQATGGQAAEKKEDSKADSKKDLPKEDAKKGDDKKSTGGDSKKDLPKEDAKKGDDKKSSGGDSKKDLPKEDAKKAGDPNKSTDSKKDAPKDDPNKSTDSKKDAPKEDDKKTDPNKSTDSKKDVPKEEAKKTDPNKSTDSKKDVPKEEAKKTDPNKSTDSKKDVPKEDPNKSTDNKKGGDPNKSTDSKKDQPKEEAKKPAEEKKGGDSKKDLPKEEAKKGDTTKQGDIAKNEPNKADSNKDLNKPAEEKKTADSGKDLKKVDSKADVNKSGEDSGKNEPNKSDSKKDVTADNKGSPKTGDNKDPAKSESKKDVTKPEEKKDAPKTNK